MASDISVGIKKLLVAYSQIKMWSKTANDILHPRAFGLFARGGVSFDWERSFQKWAAEYTEIEDTRSSLAPLSPGGCDSAGQPLFGECWDEFVPKFASKLYAKGNLTAKEKELLSSDSLCDEGRIIRPKNEEAQVLLVKAFLELGRIRPAPRWLRGVPEGKSFAEQLMSCPLETPLPYKLD